MTDHLPCDAAITFTAPGRYEVYVDEHEVRVYQDSGAVLPIKVDGTQRFIASGVVTSVSSRKDET